MFLQENDVWFLETVITEFKSLKSCNWCPGSGTHSKIEVLGCLHENNIGKDLKQRMLFRFFQDKQKKKKKWNRSLLVLFWLIIKSSSAT